MLNWCNIRAISWYWYKSKYVLSKNNGNFVCAVCAEPQTMKFRKKRKRWRKTVRSSPFWGLGSSLREFQGGGEGEGEGERLRLEMGKVELIHCHYMRC